MWVALIKKNDVLQKNCYDEQEKTFQMVEKKRFYVSTLAKLFYTVLNIRYLIISSKNN